MIIRGNTVGTSMPRTDWNQTDPRKSDYLKGRENLEKLISDSVKQVQKTADAALPSSGGSMSGHINMSGNKVSSLGSPTDSGDAATKGYVDGKHLYLTVTLPASGWQDGYQTVNVSGVTAGNTILVGYSPDSYEAYSDAGIRCTEQGNGTLTFFCESTPTSDVSANVVILN